MGFAPFRIDRLGLVTNGNEGLIDLYQPIEQISTRTNHGTPKTMQHGPSRLITPEPKHALQPQSTDPLFLIGDVPRRSQPHFTL